MASISFNTASKTYLAQAQEESTALGTILEDLNESIVDHVAIHSNFENALGRIELLKKQILHPEDQSEFEGHISDCTLLSDQIKEYYRNYLQNSIDAVVIETQMAESNESSSDLMNTCQKIEKCIDVHFSSSNSSSSDSVSSTSSSSLTSHTFSSSSSFSDSTVSAPGIAASTSTMIDPQEQLAEVEKLTEE